MKPISRIIDRDRLNKAIEFLTAKNHWTLSTGDGYNYICNKYDGVIYEYTSNTIIKLADEEDKILYDFGRFYTKWHGVPSSWVIPTDGPS